MVKWRLENGQCHQCGTQTYQVEFSEEEDPSGRKKQARRLIPVNVPSVVKNGRCLFCHPDPEPALDHASETWSLRSGASPIRDVVLPANSAGNRAVAAAAAAHPDGIIQSSEEPEAGQGVPYARKKKAPEESSEDVTRSTLKKPASKRAKRTAPGDTEQPSGPLSPTNGGEICIRDAQGVEFHGTVKEGTPEKGKGTFVAHARDGSDKKSYYEGEFKDGYMEGTGTQRDSMGCVYRGRFSKGAAHGFGTCIWPSGWVYEGEWFKDLRQGRGTCRQDVEGGEVYSGEWNADMWHGKGELTFAGGDKYVGEFRDDKMEGEGVYVFSNGSRYEGSFKNNFRWGHGQIAYDDGTRYVGTSWTILCVSVCMSPFREIAVFLTSVLDSFFPTGEWKRNWREGRGTSYGTDGTVFEGTFRADERCDGFLRMSDGFMRPVKNGRLKG